MHVSNQEQEWKSGRESAREWYEDSFGDDYLLVYPHRDLAGANQEVRVMVNWLDLPQGAEILDLCCGMGRHALAMLQSGYRVTGVDLSSVLLEKARNLPGADGIQFIQGDMRHVPLDRTFDAIVNLFTSFGYFREDQQNQQVLHEMHRLLKPKGRFIIDYLNPSYLRANLVAMSTRQEGDWNIIEKRSIDSNYVRKQITIEPVNQVSSDGTVVHPDHPSVDTKQERHHFHETSQSSQNSRRMYQEQVKLYELDIFAQMIAEAGLKLDHVYGSYEGQAYEKQQAKRMIIIGHK